MLTPWVAPAVCLLLPPVDLVNRDVEALGNIFHGLAGGWDDAHTLGNGFGRDGVVTSNHDNLGKGQADVCAVAGAR